MIFGGLIDTIIVVLIFTLGIKFNEKYPTAAHYCAFVWNAAEAIAKFLYGLTGLGTTTPPATPAAK
jgi:hypothetical protein